MPLVDSKDLAKQVEMLLAPVLAERDMMIKRLTKEVNNLREALRMKDKVLERCGVGYKAFN